METQAEVYRVTQGSRSRWFTNRDDAKQYANDCFDKYVDGIPFIEPVTAIEMISRLNDLENLSD